MPRVNPRQTKAAVKELQAGLSVLITELANAISAGDSTLKRSTREGLGRQGFPFKFASELEAPCRS
jgi:hypothetical protein